MKIRRRHYLSKREIKEILRKYKLPGMITGGKLPNMVRALADDIEVYIINNIACIAIIGGTAIPTLRCLLEYGFEWMPYLIVDRGAARALVRGAHLMAPGVKAVAKEFKASDIIIAVDEESMKPVAVLKALVDSDKLANMIETKAKGRVALNIHRPGDKLWDVSYRL